MGSGSLCRQFIVSERRFLIRVGIHVNRAPVIVELPALITYKAFSLMFGENPTARLGIAVQCASIEWPSSLTPFGNSALATSTSDGRISLMSSSSLLTWPGRILPGQFAINGTRVPQSVSVALPPGISRSAIFDTTGS